MLIAVKETNDNEYESQIT